jgi:hypothetical protein
MKLEEAAERAVICALFRELPDAFVWIGGSVLHLLLSSPRASYDLDLSPRQDAVPVGSVVRVVRSVLAEVNPAVGTSLALEESKAAGPGNSVRLRVVEQERFRFAIDLTRVTGRLEHTRVVMVESLVGPQAVVVPTDSCLLVLKLEALLFRRFLKPADVFDVWFLASRGIRLDKQQRARLSDQVLLRQVDFSDVEGRLGTLTPQRFLADLKKRLSAGTFAAWNERQAQSVVNTVLRLLRKDIRWP